MNHNFTQDINFSNSNRSFPLLALVSIFTFLYHWQDFYQIWLWATQWVSYKKQELFTIHLGSPQLVCVWSMLLIFLIFCVVFLFVCLHSVSCVQCYLCLVSNVTCVLCPMLPVSLDCPFLIAPSVFSHVH
jgi:hypothetical protein